MNEDKYQKWLKWIQIIVGDVTIMLRNRFVYNGVQSIIAANANLHQSNVFYDCFNKLYVDSVTMGIRRQLDESKRKSDSISLVKLLREIELNPEDLSRKRFIGINIPSAFSGDQIFDARVGVGEQYIQVSAVQKEIGDLKAVGERIKTYADKRVAHTDDQSVETIFPIGLPTVKEANDCLDLIEDLTVRYSTLLTGLPGERGRSEETGLPNDGSQLIPSDFYGWKEIFCYPWIPESLKDRA